MSNKGNFVLFDGYEGKSSTRYQTKRALELKNKNENAEKQLKLLELALSNLSNLTDDEILIYEKRYASLLKLFKQTKTKDLNQLFIPFRLDSRTVVFIREKNCFRPKWTKLIGEDFIEKRITDYKNILFKKPKDVIYWNPFF